MSEIAAFPSRAGIAASPFRPGPAASPSDQDAARGLAAWHNHAACKDTMYHATVNHNTSFQLSPAGQGCLLHTPCLVHDIMPCMHVLPMLDCLPHPSPLLCRCPAVCSSHASMVVPNTQLPLHSRCGSWSASP